MNHEIMYYDSDIDIERNALYVFKRQTKLVVNKKLYKREFFLKKKLKMKKWTTNRSFVQQRRLSTNDAIHKSNM